MNLKSQNRSNCILFAKFKISHVKSMIQLLCNPVDSSAPVSSVLGISQVRILEWVAISSSRGSSWPWDWTRASCIGRQILYHWATKEALLFITWCCHCFLPYTEAWCPGPPSTFLPSSPLQDAPVFRLQVSAGGLISWEDEGISLSSNPLSFTEPFASLFSFISP